MMLQRISGPVVISVRPVHPFQIMKRLVTDFRCTSQERFHHITVTYDQAVARDLACCACDAIVRNFPARNFRSGIVSNRTIAKPA